LVGLEIEGNEKANHGDCVPLWKSASWYNY